jgi:hypothetical protein
LLRHEVAGQINNRYFQAEILQTPRGFQAQQPSTPAMPFPMTTSFCFSPGFDLSLGFD